MSAFLYGWLGGNAIAFAVFLVAGYSLRSVVAAALLCLGVWSLGRGAIAEAADKASRSQRRARAS